MGVLSFADFFSGDTAMTLGRWAPGKVKINSGIQGGPMAFFDKKDTVIISPFSEFTATNTFFDSEAGSISWGLKGGIEEVPENFLQQYIVMYSPDGINAAFREWGDVMRSYYNRPSSYRESDLTNNYLGYWTDNGAYYYYHPADQQNYEDTVYGVIDYANKLSIPYRYFQYDEWFYNTDQHIGTLTWDALPGVFPDGLRYVYNKTQWPVSAHNKWWSSNTTYAKQNGGQFDFVLEDDVGFGIPLEEEFWNSLFREAKTWGMIVYEQDFLGTSNQKMKSLNTDVYLTKNWLNQMGNAAQKNGITLQYCMAFPLHILAALEIPTVTQARVSADGVPGNTNGWKIGITSLFPQAMGIAPYKDNFWTTEYQPGNPYGGMATQPFLQLTVSVLTTGPVGPSDGIGFTNVDLLMRCCNKEGLILKPDLPALAIDNQIRQEAFADGSGPMGEVYVTKSVINGLEFGIIFAADMKESYQLRPSETGLNVTSGMVMPTVFFYSDNPIVKFTEDNPLSLTTECATFQFCLYYTSPVLTVGNLTVMIYGEVGKVTPMSNNRVKGIRATSDGDIRIRVAGSGNESVIFRFLQNTQTVDITCVIGMTSTATISLLNRNCESF
ncbi:uncharacterized protein LOC126831737 [Patella vulgata]|uniref:uncharacterized protein LOC126831737 n=1 Tax=Patella vulgata TaxID=6465 RepID=UPI0024A9431A|nr:uncharacterized protein LOC126831737 [Patella vulgata]